MFEYGSSSIDWCESNYKVILTGGYSKLFKKHISKKSIIDENITVKGIIKVYKVTEMKVTSFWVY